MSKSINLTLPVSFHRGAYNQSNTLLEIYEHHEWDYSSQHLNSVVLVASDHWLSPTGYAGILKTGASVLVGTSVTNNFLAQNMDITHLEICLNESSRDERDVINNSLMKFGTFILGVSRPNIGKIISTNSTVDSNFVNANHISDDFSIKVESTGKATVTATLL